jgi:hypothetical protein
MKHLHCTSSRVKGRNRLSLSFAPREAEEKRIGKEK